MIKILQMSLKTYVRFLPGGINGVFLQVRCAGTSLFLKNKFGIGYHLTLVLDGEHFSIVLKIFRMS